MKTRSQGVAGFNRVRVLAAIVVLCAMSTVSLAQTAVTISPPNLGGALAGRVAGAPSVTPTGGSRYSIPIAIPPGTAGLAPSVSLEYSSQTGVADLGFGWRIGGLSIITRCARTTVDDGVSESVRLIALDSFCLDGQRLKFIAGSGTHGATAEYRTKSETFSQITSTGTNTAKGPDKFTVKTRGGLVLTYGNTADATIEAQGKTTVLVWALARAEDRRGNYFEVKYSETNASGEYYPQKIRYTGNVGQALTPYNAVDFIYTARAPEVVKGYVAGSLVSRTQRLTAVQTRTNTAADGTGGVLVRDYRVAYTTNASNGRALVSAVSDCDGTGNCLPATAFAYSQRDAAANTLQAPGSGTWGTMAVTFDTATGSLPKQQQIEGHVHVIDVDGDGRADLVYNPGAGTNWNVCRSTDAGFTCSTWVGPQIASKDIIPGDFDGDGKTDFLIPPTNTGFTDGTWQRCRSTGMAFDCSLSFLAPAYARVAANYMAGDFNADGRDDLVVLGPPGEQALGASRICLSTGIAFSACTTFDASPPYLQHNPDTASYINLRLTGDLNGDGRPDVLVFGGQVVGTINSQFPSNPVWRVYEGAATGIGSGTGWVGTSAGRPIMNANYASPYTPSIVPGRSNIANFNDDLFEPYGDVHYRFTASMAGVAAPVTETCSFTGTGLVCTSISPQSGMHTANAEDVDGDGRADIDVSTLGTCQLSPTGVRSNCVTWSAGDSVTGYPRAGDFNGDGILDEAIYVEATGAWFVKLRGNGGYQDLLGTVTDGAGLVTQFSYKGLHDSAVYTRGTDVAYPKRNVPVGPSVVSQLRVANGLGGWLATDYRYEGLRRNLQENGLLGFAQFTSVDQASGIATVVAFSQEPATTGMPLSVTALPDIPVGPVVVLSATTHTLASFATAGGATYAYVQASATTTRDLNGTLVATTTSSVNTGGIDPYGNVTNATETVTDNNSETFSTTSVATYDNLIASWLIGLPRTTTITKSISQIGYTTPAVTRNVAIDYDAFGMALKETVEPGNPTFQVVTDYARNLFGLLSSRTVTWTDPILATTKTRLESWAYDTRNRYPTTVSNALNHSETRSHDEGSGNLLTLTGPNALTTTWQYDGWGRPVNELRADGTSTNTAYRQCVDTCLNGAVTVRITRNWFGASQTTVPAEEFSDKLGRPVLSRSWGFDGTAILTERTFDAQGRQDKAGRPRLASASPIWTYYDRDALGRPTQVRSPAQAGSGFDTTTIAYNGLSVTTTNAKGQARTELRNGAGKLRRSTDAANFSTNYFYDPFGNLARTVDPKGNQINIGYDRYGRKTTLADPDLGSWSYLVDPVGQTRRQTDARSQQTTFDFDALGRMTRRLEPDLDSRWAYDTGTKGVGKLYEAYTWVAGAKDYWRIHIYNSHGKPSVDFVRAEWDFYTRYDYDTFGRRFTTANSRNAQGTCCAPDVRDRRYYNAQGYLYRHTSFTVFGGVTSPETVIWEAKAQDAEHRITREQLGNGLITDRGFNLYTGALQAIVSGPNNGSGGATPSHQNDSYAYDSIGNVTSRSQLVATSGALLSESLGYDNLNRLLTSQVAGQALKSFAFDEIGNLSSKTGVGTYTYAASGAASLRPHAVASISGAAASLGFASPTYDNNGNTLTAFGRSYNWTAANLVKDIDRNPGGGAAVERTTFVHGPERQRVKQIITPVVGGSYGSPTTQITYAGGMERERDTASNTTIMRTYLPRGVGYVEERIPGIAALPGASATPNLRYFLRDHLGSVAAVTDAAGAVLQRMSHDAWGKRRNADGSDDPNTFPNAIRNTQDHSGFTGHEQLDHVALVHMNARVYDPITSRFLSPDPTVPDPADTQSLNRFSYVLNSPLGFVDPSGLAAQRLSSYRTNYFAEVGFDNGSPMAGSRNGAGSLCPAGDQWCTSVFRPSGTDTGAAMELGRRGAAEIRAILEYGSASTVQVARTVSSSDFEFPVGYREGDWIRDEEGTYHGRISITGSRPRPSGGSTDWSIATTLIPFAGSSYDIYRGVRQGDRTQLAMGVIGLGLDFTGVGGVAFRGARLGAKGGTNFFRGAKAGEAPSFVPRGNEFRVDSKTGFVKDTHGVSVFDNPLSVSSKGFVPHRVDQSSIPDSLRIIQRGSDPRHFEISPRPGANLTPQQFINACSSIVCVR